jgi:aryl-alcohol dehydrogenase-like predicted oxidoreductase
MASFLQTTLGATGIPVFRLGLSASYRPGRRIVDMALDEGVNYFFGYGFDSHLIQGLRGLNSDRREKVAIATGAYNYIWGRQNLKKTLEKRLRQLRTDYIDVFHFLAVMKPGQFGPAARAELQELRSDPRVRAVAISCHHRKMLGELAAAGELDVAMVRYNAAHRGAEQDIFPYVHAHGTGVVSYTATRWRYLLRRPRTSNPADPVPTAGHCYRFVLTNPHVHVVLTAPSNERQFQENLSAVRQGPLAVDEMQWMRRFGDVVHAGAGWFM